MLVNVIVSLEKGRIFGLIGPNGAGQAACVNVITGFKIPSSRAVMLDDENTNIKAPYDIRCRGLA